MPSTWLSWSDLRNMTIVNFRRGGMMNDSSTAKLRVKSRKTTIGNGQYLVTPGYSNVSRKTWTRYAVAGAETLPSDGITYQHVTGSLHFIRRTLRRVHAYRDIRVEMPLRGRPDRQVGEVAHVLAAIESRKMMSTLSITEHNTTSNLIVFRGRRPTMFTSACRD